MYAYEMKQPIPSLQCFIFPYFFFPLGKMLEKLAEDTKVEKRIGDLGNSKTKEKQGEDERRKSK